MPAIAAISIPAKSVVRWRFRQRRTGRGRGPFGENWGRMRSDTTSAASAIFAANRAQGSVTFDVHQIEGVTRRRQLHESGSLRVRFPSPEAEGPSAGFVKTPGGLARGGPFGHGHAAHPGS